MEQNILDEVREIKKSLRLAMNGIVSTIQRRQGLDYKINFGVEIPRLKGIADAHAKNRELATTLWQDNIRECKMLAIFLMPEENFEDLADKWIEETKFTEIADQLAMHLLCRLPAAWEKALQWIATSEGMAGYCGFLTVSHLIRRNIEPTPQQEQAFFKSIASLNVQEEKSITERCALNAIMNYLDRSSGAVGRFKDAIPEDAGNTSGLAIILKNFEE